MTENSYLNPVDIVRQSVYAIWNLEKDNDAVAIAENKLCDFANDTELQGDAFDTLKQQISDYSTVLQALRSANDSDIADFDTLAKSVGTSVLDGSVIIPEKNNAYNDMLSYNDTANSYLARANNCSWWEYLLGTSQYYMQMAAHYAYLASVSEEIFHEFEAKEEAYDDIESATQGLFSASESTRQAAKNALKSMANSFVDGKYVPDMEAAWRIDIVNCYYERVFTETDDGTLTINMQEVEKILKKDAADITPQEYEVITLAFLNADESELEKIIQYTMGEKTDYEFDFAGKTFGNRVEHSEWKVDNEKLNTIQNYVAGMAEISLAYIHEFRNIPDSDLDTQMVKQRDVMLQRLSLLNIVSGIGKFRGEYDSDYPAIEITADDNGDLTLTFCEYRNVGSDMAPAFYDLGESTVTISATVLGSRIDDHAASDIEYRFASYFGNYSVAQETGKFVADQVTGEMISNASEQFGEYVTKTLGKETLGKAIGFIPLVGDIAGFALDASMDSAQAEQDTEFMQTEFTKLESALVYADFDCCANFIEYDMYDNTGNVIFAYPGERTDEIIAELNEAFGTNFDREQLLKNTNEVWNIKEKIISDRDKKYIYDDIVKNKE